MTPATTPSLGRFSWHELLTPDPVAAQAFYTHVIGWTTSAWGAGADAYIMWMAGEKPVGGVMKLPDAAAAMGAPPHWLAYIASPDVDATIARAVELGATVLVAAQTVPEVGRFGVMQDPQGAVFAVITPETPPAEETDPGPGEFSWHELTAASALPLIDFYQELFNWDRKSEFDMGPMGLYRIFGRGRFDYLGVMERPEGMEMSPYWLHYVSVADSADAAAERATAAGGKLMHGPMDVPGGDRIAILNDPQGAWFAVHSKPKA